MSDKFFVGLDLTGIQDNGAQRPISRVTLLLDDNNAATAGDDTGAELTADCPHATQEMAEAILAQIKGLKYRMFSASDARLDPAAELGDGITAGGMYSVISRLDDDGSGFPSISAPGEAELEDEYPAGGPMTREFNRKLARTNSRITKTAEEIRLEVLNEVEGLSASIDVKIDSITNRVENAESGLSQTLRIAADGVTITNASGSTLTIDGGQIDASKIKTDQLDASKIRAGDLNLTGAISWGDLDYNARNQVTSAQSDASLALSTAASAANTVSGWRYGDSTYINGSMIAAGTVMASNLRGQYVYLDNSAGDAMGVLSITGAQTSYAAIDLTSYGALRLTANYGAAYLESSQYNTYVEAYDRVYTRGALVSRNGSSLGDNTYRWSDVYANNAIIQTSDLTVKKNVEYGLSRYDTLFDALRPMSFLFRDGESGRRHLGLGAQDVERAMEDSGVSDMEFAGFIRSPKQDGDGLDYALRYGEFIPLCIEQIQRLKRRVEGLERRMS